MELPKQIREVFDEHSPRLSAVAEEEALSPAPRLVINARSEHGQVKEIETLMVDLKGEPEPIDLPPDVAEAMVHRAIDEAGENAVLRDSRVHLTIMEDGYVLVELREEGDEIVPGIYHL